ncbi:MAG: restriction endonuclease, partial [Synergistaceae bacterium]|nr:restriction endonuclease [Synergistaceae bacterium]
LFIEFLRKIPEYISSYRAKKTGVSELTKLSGREFEIWLANLFRRMGYKVRLLRGYKDYGADLIVTNFQGRKWAVQAKKRSGSKTGVSAIGEVLRGQNYYKCDLALVVTNSDFTKQAYEEARACGVVLWNREKLISISEKLRRNGLKESVKN